MKNKKLRWLFILLLISSFSYASEPITPLPLSVKYDKQKALLGKKLFSDPILSKDGTVSCLSCHNLYNGGCDNVAYSTGINGQKGEFNAPTVFNSRYNFKQFWNGRSENLQTQAIEPILNPVEMGNDKNHLLQSLRDSAYVKEFETLYADGITIENLTDALSEFQKALVTVNSPFDRYLRGEKDAISQKAKRGYALFKSKGCITCHHGIGVGGNHFNKFGIIRDINISQKGRFDVTKEEEDKFYFKVPSLRNVAITAPYFHDGQTKSLKDAVKLMSYYQLGRDISEEDIEDIVSFLESLTGELPDIVK